MKIKTILNELLSSYISNIVKPSYRLELTLNKAIELQEMLIENYEKKIIQSIKENNDKN